MQHTVSVMLNVLIHRMLFTDDIKRVLKLEYAM